MATNNPPINERFLAIAASWKGTKWKIIVVGTKKIKSKEQANLILSVKSKRKEPQINSAMAASIMIIDINSGNPLLTMYWTWELKSIIFPGIAFINIALRSNLPRKFKE